MTFSDNDLISGIIDPNIYRNSAITSRYYNPYSQYNTPAYSNDYLINNRYDGGGFLSGLTSTIGKIGDSFSSAGNDKLFKSPDGGVETRSYQGSNIKLGDTAKFDASGNLTKFKAFGDKNILGKMGSASKSQLSSTFGKASSMASKAGGALAVAGAAVDMMKAFKANSSIADTTQFKNDIKDYAAKNITADTNSSLNEEFANTFAMEAPTYRQVRGSTKGQQALNSIKAGVSGAQAGAQVGGPYGAAIGAVAGIGAGIAGAFRGKKKAERELAKLERAAQVATETRQHKLRQKAELIEERADRAAAANYAAYGGRFNVDNPMLYRYFRTI